MIKTMFIVSLMRVILIPILPIQLRFNELISGVRSDVAVKVFGDDMEVLNDTAAKVSAVLEKVPGATGVKVEQTTGLPMLTVNIDREMTSRYGLNVNDVQEIIATATGGREAGTVFQGDRRFDVLEIVRTHQFAAHFYQLFFFIQKGYPNKGL